MKKFRALAASALAATALLAGAALPADAASFAPRHVPGGSYQYNDGTDTFCVRSSGVGRGIAVTLTPTNRARGPVLIVSNFWEDGRSQACTSLARAYEDTYYTASVSSWVNGKRSSTSYGFYS